MVNNIWLIRHGLRADFEDKNWRNHAERPYDPPLSQNGEIQAKETAAFLKNRQIDALFASPYLRTMQTADYISRETDLKVKVEPGFGEWLNPAWFDRYPALLSHDELKKRFSAIDKHYSPFLLPRFPEQNEDVEMFERLKKTLNYIIRHYNGDIVIVGHGATLSQAGRALLGLNQELTCRTCGINFLRYQENGWKLKFATSEHLTVNEEKIRFH